MSKRGFINLNIRGRMKLFGRGIHVFELGMYGAYDVDVEVTKECIREVFKNVLKKNVREKLSMTQ